jgi:hypothetical protein
MTDEQLAAARADATSRLCESCWKNEWPPGGQYGYESWGMYVCEACYYSANLGVEAPRSLRTAVGVYRQRARGLVLALCEEVAFLKTLLADRRLESAEANRIACQREALDRLVHRLADLPMLVEQDAELYRRVREGKAALGAPP